VTAQPHAHVRFRRAIERRGYRIVVNVGDDVEIGANACVDRGSHGDTVLGPGTLTLANPANDFNGGTPTCTPAR
jgi:hypothetical protein